MLHLLDWCVVFFRARLAVVYACVWSPVACSHPHVCPCEPPIAPFPSALEAGQQAPFSALPQALETEALSLVRHLLKSHALPKAEAERTALLTALASAAPLMNPVMGATCVRVRVGGWHRWRVHCAVGATPEPFT
jgi:hypothetical protein